MNVRLAVLTALLLAVGAVAQQQFRTVNVGGVSRSYLLYVPPSYSQATPAPVVMNLHGWAGTSQGYMTYADMRPLADANGFLLAYPQALVGPSGVTEWDSAGPYAWGADEVGFMAALLDDLEANFSVNSDQCYICGFSSACSAVWDTACQLNDRIAAAATVAGVMWNWTQQNCAPTHPTPTVTIHGTNDFDMPYAGSQYSLSLVATGQYWSQANNGDATPTIVSLPDIVPGDGSTVDRFTWANGDDCTEVVHYRVNNGPHEWPGVAGNMDINASQIIWDFFAQYDLNGQIGCVGSANFQTFGAGCAGSPQLPVPTCAQANAAGGALNQTTSSDEHVYRVAVGSVTTLANFDLFTRSTGGTVTLPARVYAASGSGPAAAPIATTTMTVGPTAGFYTATFDPPVTTPAVFYIGVDNTTQTTLLSDLSVGTYNIGYKRTGSGAWSFELMRPSWSVQCTNQPLNLTPSMDAVGLPQLGASYTPSVTDALPSTPAILLSGLSDQLWQGNALPLSLPGAPGCALLVAAEASAVTMTDATGSANLSVPVPNAQNLIGLQVFHQWAIWDPSANNLAIVTSDGGAATIGN